MKRKRTPDNIRWTTQCKHTCPCGVEMIGIEPDLESWLYQHLLFSGIHKAWVEKYDYLQLDAEVMAWDM